MQERIASPAREEQVGTAVVVVVAHGHAVAVAVHQAADPGGRRDVLEGPVAAIAEEAIAARRPCSGWEGPALHEVDVKPAVAVIIEQSRPRRCRSREDDEAARRHCRR